MRPAVLAATVLAAACAFPVAQKARPASEIAQREVRFARPSLQATEPAASPALDWLVHRPYASPPRPAAGAHWEVGSPYAALSRAAPGDTRWSFTSPYVEASRPRASGLAGEHRSAALDAGGAGMRAARSGGLGLSLTSGTSHRGQVLLETTFVPGSSLGGSMGIGTGVTRNLDLIVTLAGGVIDVYEERGDRTRDRGFFLAGLTPRFHFLRGWLKPFVELPVKLGYVSKADFAFFVFGGFGVQLDWAPWGGFVFAVNLGGGLNTSKSYELETDFHWGVAFGPQFRF